MSQSYSDRYFAEWEVEPPNGVYPTLDDWSAALAEVKRQEAQRQAAQTLAVAAPAIRTRNPIIAPTWVPVPSSTVSRQVLEAEGFSSSFITSWTCSSQAPDQDLSTRAFTAFMPASGWSTLAYRSRR